eukprot:CAMPEP_0114578106 /NCGR_PEP_ID=MMETSP0125-20121206/2684_1 /TAXON_ID=485358 ORGANISM="Aristerostoma sp., Strain ATCC 50986" /NCGR_SAMPLE_ID=MMETSP0125 /ASSEMBLY_ACC=CAM_ASM_000245 /LENGTH=127 /DNA_ID=CAMNT_0001767921 /DNA_START=45 /DNA_END=425 /DNA_ORIENTATION=+
MKDSSTIQSYLTNSNVHFQAQSNLTFTSGNPPSGPTLSLDPSTKYQTIKGYGAALTDSSAFLISEMPEDQQNELLHDLFDPQQGIGINFLRLPISACDFSLENYTYDSMPEGHTDPLLSNFSIKHDQ